MPSANNKRPGDSIDGDDHLHSLDNRSPTKTPRTDDASTAHDSIGHTNGNSNELGNGSASNYPGAPSKKKSGASTRTGQACDRCKIRKIRCDARPGGCSPCLQNNTECKTTDRITGRATSRGHTENVENENQQLKTYMIELQQQLRDNGVEPKPPPAVPPGYSSAFTNLPYHPTVPSQSWENQPSSVLTTSPQVRERQGSQSSALPDFRAGCIGDNYLGVSSENNWLSTIEGTSLALFGTKIDLTEFMPPDSDPANSAMSYRVFLDHAFGKSKPYAPPLPAYEQCKIFAEWYFRSVQTFMPVLHKPDHMRLIARIHNENYQPSSAELVMVHMVLAILNFQFSSRNANQQAWIDSMNHYHYALSFIPDLVAGHRFEDIQALVLICSQLRNQPRPGAAWMFTNMVMGLAVESGLHRSAKAWQGSAMNHDSHHFEMRKRVFWSLFSYHVHISGKLGRPMPLRVEDFDIEIPEPQPDHLPGEPVPNKWKKCSWRAAYEGFKLLKVMTQVYSSIYSIRSTGQYEMNVRTLEKELDTFYASIPPELQGGPQTKDEDRVSALYLDLSVAECQLLLHHPALCRSASPEVIRKNLDVCLHWSNKMLDAAALLKDLKSLDTTWYYWADFIAAIFTTLFASTERRDQMTSEDLHKLREDMDRWMDVMGEASVLLGTNPNLQASVKQIIDFSIGNISRHIAAKTASAAVASTASPTSPDPPQSQQLYETQAGANQYYSNAATNGQAYIENSTSHQQTQAAYPSGNQFAYPPAHDSNMSTYTNGTNSSSYNQSTYTTADAKPNIEAQLVASIGGHSSQPSTFMPAFSSHQQDHNGYQHHMNGHDVYQPAGPAAWRNFANDMMTNVSGPEYMHSAGALMTLSGGKHDDGGASMNTVAAGIGQFQHPPSGDGNQPWPLIAYNAVDHNGTPH